MYMVMDIVMLEVSYCKEHGNVYSAVMNIVMLTVMHVAMHIAVMNMVMCTVLLQQRIWYCIWIGKAYENEYKKYEKKEYGIVYYLVNHVAMYIK